MAFLLTQLLEGAGGTIPLGSITVTGINANSNDVSPGEAFFALPGTRVHGEAFIRQAVENGAKVIVSDRRPEGDPGVDIVVVDDVRRIYAQAAARMMQPQPSVSVAVTGTNGKTSVASFVRQIWQANNIAGASVGTLGIDVAGRLMPGTLTTPDPLSLHKTLAVLKAGGTDHVVIEASSHGLEQRRLDGISFKAVGFTNIDRDHLDYHGDLETYRNAKLRLFTELLAADGAAVINTDHPQHDAFMFAALDRGVTLLTVGTDGAYFEISSVEREGYGQKVTGRLVGEPVEFTLPLAGRFQVDNAVMAAALALQSGAEIDETIRALGKLKGAKGRMELVGQRGDAAIFVDYSHKPVALQSALEALRPYATGRLAVVFGCGGDRDRGKRPMMGEIAVQLADKVIVTDDNPRTEDAAGIRREIMAAAPGAIEIGDRGEAIAAAVADLADGDVLLVAGKGHEDYQIVGTEKRPFSDHEAIGQALKR